MIMTTSRTHRFAPRAGLVSLLLLAATACGSPPPPQPVTSPPPTNPIVVEKEKPIDVSPVPDPPNLILVGRITKPDALVQAAAAWTKLPLPSGADLVRSIADDSVGDVVDLTQPIDVAGTIGLSRHGIDPLFAFSVSVKSFDQARGRLGSQHKLVPIGNGALRVVGIGKHSRPPPPPRMPGEAPRDDDDDDDDGDGCVLAHAMQGARIVCGESAALESLVPYLTRTLPRQTWTSDVHLELRPEPVRGPLAELRGSLPALARSMMGSQSPAVRELVDSGIGEVMDIVSDAQKLQIDAQVNESGVVASTRFDFQSTKSTFARVLTASDKAGEAPPAFWHLPGDTDTALFGRGTDPKLWEHPRELLTNLLVEAADSAQMPEAERKAVKDLIGDRMLTLFTNGGFVYGKGFDQAAIEKITAARKNVKPDDQANRDETTRLLLEQVVGWHLFQVTEPVAKVGPILKDWSALWNRPAFAKWFQSKSGVTNASTLPKMRLAPNPAGVTMPKDTVHLEVTIPRDDIIEPSVSMTPPPPPPPPGGKRPPPTPAPKLAPPKKIARKPIVFHVFAVPDGSATWLAFGLDPKLVAQKAAASIATAPDANTLGKVGKGNEALREGKMNGGGLFTIRGFAVLAALDHDSERTPFTLLGTLPAKGATPITMTARADGPSGSARGGTGHGTLRVSRAVIEDMVKLVMTSR